MDREGRSRCGAESDGWQAGPDWKEEEVSDWTGFLECRPERCLSLSATSDAVVFAELLSQ